MLLTWNISLFPSRFKLTDLLLWQQQQDELRKTKWSKIERNHQQSNQQTELAMYEEQAPGVKECGVVS